MEADMVTTVNNEVIERNKISEVKAAFLETEVADTKTEHSVQITSVADIVEDDIILDSEETQTPAYRAIAQESFSYWLDERSFDFDNKDHKQLLNLIRRGWKQNLDNIRERLDSHGYLKSNISEARKAVNTICGRIRVDGCTKREGPIRADRYSRLSIFDYMAAEGYKPEDYLSRVILADDLLKRLLSDEITTEVCRPIIRFTDILQMLRRGNTHFQEEDRQFFRMVQPSAMRQYHGRDDKLMIAENMQRIALAVMGEETGAEIVGEELVKLSTIYKPVFGFTTTNVNDNHIATMTSDPLPTGDCLAMREFTEQIVKLEGVLAYSDRLDAYFSVSPTTGDVGVVGDSFELPIPTDDVIADSVRYSLQTSAWCVDQLDHVNKPLIKATNDLLNAFTDLVVDGDWFNNASYAERRSICFITEYLLDGLALRHLTVCKETLQLIANHSQSLTAWLELTTTPNK